MADNRTLVNLVILSFALTAFSGCFADEANPDSTTGGTGGPSSDANATGDPTAGPGIPTTSVPAEPPIANFTVAPANASVANLTAGSDLIFNASMSTDPAGGDLTYAWDFGDNATAEGAVTNHTFADAGNFTVSLTVTSGASGLVGNASQVLVIVSASRKPVTFVDASSDGNTNYHDIRSVTVSDDGLMLKFRFTTGAVQPNGNTYSPVCMNMFVTGVLPTGKPGTVQRYELFGNPDTQKYTIYDYTATAGSVAAASARVVGTGFEVLIPLEQVQKTKIDFPFQVYMESRAGDCWRLNPNQAVQTFDRAPNSGQVTYG